MSNSNSTNNDITAKTADLTVYDYDDMVSELQVVIDSFFYREVKGDSVRKIKITNRSNGIATVMVLTVNGTLWGFKFSFENIDRWEKYKIQSSARPIESKELCYKNYAMKREGKSEIEASQYCLELFEKTRICVSDEKKSADAKQAEEIKAQLK